MQYADKLDALEARFEELSRAMADPDIITDPEAYRKTAKAHRDMEEVVNKYREWKQANDALAQAKSMSQDTDPEMREMALAEIADLEPAMTRLEEELMIFLLPKDPNDDKNIVLEIRAGTGGDEATLFAAELWRMYTRYFETQRWKVDITDLSDSSVGGIKEVIAVIADRGAQASLALHKKYGFADQGHLANVAVRFGKPVGSYLLALKLS